jgi:hypothetical protein
MIYFSWTSTTSPFYRKFRNDNDYKVKENVIFEVDTVTKELEQIEIRISKKRFPSEVRLFELYAELGDYRAVSTKVGLPVMTCYELINRVRIEMKKKI